MSNDLISYRARWVFPVASPPIENGVVAIRGDKIVDISLHHNWHGPAPHDLGDIAIIPALVNAHTHLEFSELQSPLGAPGTRFADWINLVVAHRQKRLPDQQHKSITLGIAESTAAGVCAIGEISTPGYSPDWLSGATPRIVSFHESIGLTCESATERIQYAANSLTTKSEFPIRGLSPHTPYTVRWSFLNNLIQLAIDHNAPVAMHVAETEAELELLSTRSGSLRIILEQMQIWRDDAYPSNASIRSYLEQLARTPRSLVVHGNYLTHDDINFIAQHQARMSVVYCPRTHAFFGHSPHPYPAMLQSGINVALGTDSRASNPDLSIFNEMRFVMQQGRISPTAILQLGTLNGACALGLANDYGTIEVGKPARLCVISSSNQSATNVWHSIDPHEPLFRDEMVCKPLTIDN